jgi:hypothetical protein
MRVDHRRADVAVPEQRLNRANVVAVFQEMSREGMAEGMAGRRLGDPGGPNRIVYRALEDGLVEMVPAPLSCHSVHVGPRRGEDPLPSPFAARVRVLQAETAGQLHPVRPALGIDFMQTPNPLQLSPERLASDRGKERHTVLVTLSAPNDDVMGLEVDVLYPEPCAFQEPQAGS